MILEVDKVSKQFTSHLALDNVSLSVPRGSVYGLLGPNGAGKTTLIRIINHITAPDSGCVMFDGHQLTENDLVNIGYLPEERGLYKKMKVGEQAMFFAQLKGLSRRDAEARLKGWFDRFGILDWWGKKVTELSKGMAQKVQFIVTVLHEPKLLIFDEPFSGFDPLNAQLLKDEILRLRDAGATVIFSTHNMSSVEEICDSFTLINKSKNILSGSVSDVKRRFAEGRYDFMVQGDATAVIPRLMPMVESSDTTLLENDRTLLSVKLLPDVALRDAITAVNDSATLVGVSEKLPNMNDIFISAVHAANQTTDSENE
ncbi:MAG: ATP-binding cassette domain-containing protein [Bacteroides sp.]|nr:ATP-binding cassette domain-containing protein [Bacteroides sp.]MCM1380185.1 ATP-binding cassette domain-containing protein [Bacteroides sp.]MCM1446500.1 ATP-binding cassette domain-containing protein [Prevotella sp.]